MSGIAGVVRLDGARVAESVLERCASFLAFRGPDAQRTWSHGPAGLAHTLFRATDDTAADSQPLSFDQRAWIVADARVDARADLLAALAAGGRRVSAPSPDAELILHAWHAWGESCVEHLLGDFAFAIWDAGARRLFCARDHFGVKPFFYAAAGAWLAFSNTLECLRLLPEVSDGLDEAAVADSLLFGHSRYPEATVYADIRRLPAAHTLSVAPEGIRLRRYWTLPVDEPLRFRRESDYVDEFRALLASAVRDRLRSTGAAFSLSGGLDSSTAAATALAQLRPRGAELVGHTAFSRHLFRDPERRYAELLGRALDIPVEFLEVDEFELYHGWREGRARLVEPVNEPFIAIHLELVRRMARRHRVALTGHGGDPAFSTSITAYARSLLAAGRTGQLLGDFWRFLRSEGRFSRLYPRTRLRLLSARYARQAGPPAWLNPELARRLDLAARQRQAFEQPPVPGALRPAAFRALLDPFWPHFFEEFDAGVTAVPLEFRHPFFDLRLIRFVLRIPPVPWCTDKELVRVAMRGVLPDAIRLRPKTPLQGEPAVVFLRRGGKRWWESVPPHPALASSVDWSRVPRLTGRESADEIWKHLPAYTLNLWLWRTAAPPAAGDETPSDARLVPAKG